MKTCTRNYAILLSLALGATLNAQAGVLHTRAGLCSRTAEAAVQHAVSQVAMGSAAEEGMAGYRVVSFWIDPFRTQRWAVVESCGDPHAHRQLMAVAAGLGSPAPPALPLAIRIHAGETVAVTLASQGSRMQLSGRAETGAAVGEQLRVKLVNVFGSEGFGSDQSPARSLLCVATGSGTVEVAQ